MRIIRFKKFKALTWSSILWTLKTILKVSLSRIISKIFGFIKYRIVTKKDDVIESLIQHLNHLFCFNYHKQKE